MGPHAISVPGSIWIFARVPLWHSNGVGPIPASKIAGTPSQEHLAADHPETSPSIRCADECTWSTKSAAIACLARSSGHGPATAVAASCRGRWIPGDPLTGRSGTPSAADGGRSTRGATRGQSGATMPQQRGFTSSDANVTNCRAAMTRTFVHCPSETTSTEPSSTLMAVCSSNGVGRDGRWRRPTAFASARAFPGKASRCGKIEKSTTPQGAVVRRGTATRRNTPRSGGVMTMLPALTPTQDHVRAAKAADRPARTPASSGTSTSRRRRRPVSTSAFPDPGDPSLRANGGQGGELEDTERRPSQAGEVPEVGLRRPPGPAPMRVRTFGWPHCAVGTTSALTLRRSGPCREAAGAPSGMLGFVTPPDVEKELQRCLQVSRGR